MKNNYFKESDMESHLVIQLLEDKIYEYNAAKISKDDGITHVDSGFVQACNQTGTGPSLPLMVKADF